MIVVPTSTFSVLSAVLVTLIDGAGSSVVTVQVAVSSKAVSLGAVPVAVAVFTILPASTSDCLTTYVAVTVAVSPGAIVVLSRIFIAKSGSGSLTARPLTVTFPVFVTVIV